MKRKIQYLILFVLASFLTWKGIIPAFSRVDTDFPNYYTSSRLLVEGTDLAKAYDDRWFQDRISHYGIDQQGKFSPFPPPTAFVMTPLAWMSPLDALRVWTILNLCALGATVALFSTLTRKDWRWAAIVLLAAGIGLSNNFRFGQLYLFLLLSVSAGYLLLLRHRQKWAGILFGFGIAVKYFPIVYFPIFWLRKEWKLLAVCIISIATIYGISIALLGWNIHRQFIASVFPSHLNEGLSGQDPYSSTFQSWDSLFRRLFVGHSVLNPKPLVDSYAWFVALKTTVIVLVVGIAASSLAKLHRAKTEFSISLQFAILGCAGLLLLPASATYHFVLLSLPAAIILSSRPVAWSVEQKLFCLCYAVMGFIPYSYFRAFDGWGAMSIFAYPRLALMSVIFYLAVRYSSVAGGHTLPGKNWSAK